MKKNDAFSNGGVKTPVAKPRKLFMLQLGIAHAQCVSTGLLFLNTRGHITNYSKSSP